MYHRKYFFTFIDILLFCSTPSPQQKVTPKRRAPYARNRLSLQGSQDPSGEHDETPPSKDGNSLLLCAVFQKA